MDVGTRDAQQSRFDTRCAYNILAYRVLYHAVLTYYGVSKCVVRVLAKVLSINVWQWALLVIMHACMPIAVAAPFKFCGRQGWGAVSTTDPVIRQSSVHGGQLWMQAGLDSL